MSLPRVLVLMATYNGEKYLREQIDSILAQESALVSLWIADDGSTDDTKETAKEYSAAYPNVQFTENASNLGCTDNFLSMLHSANIDDFDYLAFSDQDDIWHPNKINHAVSMLQAVSDKPCLYYSDVYNYDFTKDVPIKGGREYFPFSAYAHNIKSLLCANWASGNTMVLNKPLVELLQVYYPHSFERYHDTWVHLVALACGYTIPDLEHAYITRRISGDNEVGVRNFGTFDLKRVGTIAQTILTPNCHNLTDAAKSLVDGYSEYMTKETLDTITSFALSKDHLAFRLKIALDPEYRLPSAIDTLMAKGKVLLGKA